MPSEPSASQEMCGNAAATGDFNDMKPPVTFTLLLVGLAVFIVFINDDDAVVDGLVEEDDMVLATVTVMRDM